jgi:hypothetical protein
MFGQDIGQVLFLTNDRQDGITIYFKRMLFYFTLYNVCKKDVLPLVIEDTYMCDSVNAA